MSSEFQFDLDAKRTRLTDGALIAALEKAAETIGEGYFPSTARGISQRHDVARAAACRERKPACSRGDSPEGQVGRSEAIGRYAPGLHRRPERIQDQDLDVDCRTRGRRLPVPRRLLARGGTPGSSLGQALDDACADILPGFARRVTAHHPARSSFNLAGPGRLDFCGILRWRFIETRQEFRGNIGPFLDGQGQGFSKIQRRQPDERASRLSRET